MKLRIELSAAEVKQMLLDHLTGILGELKIDPTDLKFELSNDEWVPIDEGDFRVVYDHDQTP